jgi:hypothetical protein
MRQQKNIHIRVPNFFPDNRSISFSFQWCGDKEIQFGTVWSHIAPELPFI